MIQQGKIVKSDSGRDIRVDRFKASGGQAGVYEATEVNSGQKGILKVFHDRFANGETVSRTSFLTSQDLSSACPVLCSPIDMVHKREIVGHFTPLAPGQSLEDFLANPSNTFIEGLQMAIALAHALDVLHKRQIAHGDLNANNMILNRAGSVLQLYMIDFDNFNAPNMPLPPMVGHNLYMAPELRVALANKKPAIPNIYSDRFSLGVLMNEIILLRHVAAGADDNEVDFQKAMCSGRWLQDPAAADKPNGNLGGYPVGLLNADLARLFRLALSLDPAERPSAEKWEGELGKAYNSVFSCPYPDCGGPCVIDVSKVKCPLCGRPFPHLSLRTRANGCTFPLVNGTTIVGRVELGGSMKVSERHAVFRRIGPETWIESVGRNGTYRWNSSGWTRLPDKKPLLVQSGDILRLGDMEVQLN